MWVFILGLCVVALLSVVGVALWVNLRKNSLVLKASVLVAVFIPLSIVVLLPTDWVNHNRPQPLAGLDVGETTYLWLWRSAYWVTFALTWLVLPMVLEFYRSGHYHPIARIKDAFRANLKFQLMMLGLGILSAVYFMAEVGLTLGHFKSMVMGLTHIYSLVLTLWLMAHSLVSIPRQSWTTASPVSRLNYLYQRVVPLVDKLDDTRTGFRDDILRVMMLANNFANELEYRDWILSLERRIPDELRTQLEREYRSEEPHLLVPSVDENYMVSLTQKFNRHHDNLVAYQSEYTKLLLDITRLEDSLGHDPHSVVYRFATSNPKRTYYWTVYGRPNLMRVVAVVSAVLSVTILFSEMVHSTKVSPVNVVVTRLAGYAQWMMMIFVYCYMLVCALSSLTSVKVFNVYHLVPHDSDPVSASWYAMYVARTSFPLAYNFLGLLVSRTSVFEQWYGASLGLTGLFSALNEWLPRLILVPILMSAFNVYHRVKKRVGFMEWFDDDSDAEADENRSLESPRDTRHEHVIAEAKRLVEREMHRRTRTTA
ncbi:hypothetical protein DIURU_001863 [Diutina rugosa]|uniref:Lysosomal cobalamin transporter n=1 Tax=Diutina rugosa TaxID=5481 RepID=A0A642USG4_DIURU|nr:uncharacterized protein DIURU_001863 [Diutina rugosa]KAA8904587.1 hypothetical protein DIURU_001863 [Diutina rugosa]